MSKVQRLAAAFAAEIRHEMPGHLDDVNERNATLTYQVGGFCATQEVCDANMLMHEAWVKTFNRDPLSCADEEEKAGGMTPELDLRLQEDADLWNEAWDLAKNNQFKDINYADVRSNTQEDTMNKPSVVSVYSALVFLLEGIKDKFTEPRYVFRNLEYTKDWSALLATTGSDFLRKKNSKDALVDTLTTLTSVAPGPFLNLMNTPFTHSADPYNDSKGHVEMCRYGKRLLDALPKGLSVDEYSRHALKEAIRILHTFLSNNDRPGQNKGISGLQKYINTCTENYRSSVSIADIVKHLYTKVSELPVKGPALYTAMPTHHSSLTGPNIVSTLGKSPEQNVYRKGLMQVLTPLFNKDTPGIPANARRRKEADKDLFEVIHVHGHAYVYIPSKAAYEEAVNRFIATLSCAKDSTQTAVLREVFNKVTDTIKKCLKELPVTTTISHYTGPSVDSIYAAIDCYVVNTLTRSETPSTIVVADTKEDPSDKQTVDDSMLSMSLQDILDKASKYKTAQKEAQEAAKKRVEHTARILELESQNEELREKATKYDRMMQVANKDAK